MSVDDLTHLFPQRGAAHRVVSLVPSLTEALASVDPEALVGVTDWCTHPRDLTCARVRGTKNPDVNAIIELEPDVVVANMEENRHIDVERLREAGVPVWVTRITTLEECFRSLRRLFRECLIWPEPGWIGKAEREWSVRGSDRRRAVVPIWRDPWLVVGSGTFAGDVMARLGFSNPFDNERGRYPKVSLQEIVAQRPDLVVLPDEPYPFSRQDGPEEFDAPVALVSGRSLTWYGPSLVTAREELEDAFAHARE